MRKLKAKHDHLIEQFIDDDNYKILEDGRIYSFVNPKFTKLIGRVHDSTNKETNSKCYKKIKYKGKELKVNRIIYRKFNGILDANKVIDHIDGDSLNDHYSNLRQTTQLHNMNNKQNTNKGNNNG